MTQEQKGKTPVLDVQNLTKIYDNGGKGDGNEVLKNVNFTMNEGEFVCILGPSGCGKTTLGRTILRLYEPTGGKIIYDGETIYDNPLDKDGKPLGKAKAVKMLPYRRKMQMI